MLDSQDKVLVKRIRSRLYLELARAYAVSGVRNRGREYLIKCIRTLPGNTTILTRKLLTTFLRLCFPIVVRPLLAFKRKLAPRA